MQPWLLTAGVCGAAMFACGTAAAQTQTATPLGSPARTCFIGAVSTAATQPEAAACDLAVVAPSIAVDQRVASFVNRGVVHMTRRQNAAALADFDRALAIDPNCAEAYFNKALVLMRNPATVEAALPMLDAAIRNGVPRLEVAYFGRAVLHENRGDYRAAYRDLLRAREIAPLWEPPTRELARYSVQGSRS